MPWWVKFIPNGKTRPVAMGQFDNIEDAKACLAGHRTGPNPDGSEPPDDPGEIVEAGNDYPSTLPHVVGKVVRGDVEYQVYSDGSMDPNV